MRNAEEIREPSGVRVLAHAGVAQEHPLHASLRHLPFALSGLAFFFKDLEVTVALSEGESYPRKNVTAFPILQVEGGMQLLLQEGTRGGKGNFRFAVDYVGSRRSGGSRGEAQSED